MILLLLLFLIFFLLFMLKCTPNRVDAGGGGGGGRNVCQELLPGCKETFPFKPRHILHAGRGKGGWLFF